MSTPQFDTDSRKFGDGYTWYAAHEDHPAYGSDIFTGGSASADNEVSGAAANAFDNNTGTNWGSNAAVPSWVKYDLGVGNSATPIKLREYVGGAFYPIDFQFQGSNNDSDWTDLFVTTDRPGVAGWYDFFFYNATAYRYFRLYVTHNVADTSVQVHELEALEQSGNSAGEWTFQEMNQYQVTDGLLNFGGYSDSVNTEINLEAEENMDTITQEKFAVQSVVAEGKATFKVNMSMGDARKLAIAAGLLDSTTGTDIIDNGVTTADAEIVLMGQRKPKRMSLLHIIPNSQTSGWNDYLYMPNVQVTPTIKIVPDKKNVRSAEVMFNLSPSTQTALIENSKGMTYEFYYQSADAD